MKIYFFNMLCHIWYVSCLCVYARVCGLQLTLFPELSTPLCGYIYIVMLVFIINTRYYLAVSSVLSLSDGWLVSIHPLIMLLLKGDVVGMLNCVIFFSVHRNVTFVLTLYRRCTQEVWPLNSALLRWRHIRESHYQNITLTVCVPNAY